MYSVATKSVPTCSPKTLRSSEMESKEQASRQALIHKRYDKAYKMLLGNPDAFCRFMRSLVDEKFAQRVQPQNIEQVNKSFITKEGREYESDLIYKVIIDSKYEAYFYILMEFQSSPDRLMPLRMLNYVVQFWQSLESAKAGKLPAVFPIVLYNGDPKWNAATDILQCIENAGIPEKYLPKMSYYLIDISKIEKLTEMDTLVASVVYAEQHSEDNQRKDYIEKLGHLAKEIVPNDLREIFLNWFVTISTGTMPSEKILQMQDTLKERGGSMLATLGERIYNEGREEGIEQGIEKGIQTGIQKGREAERMEVAKNMLSGGLSVAQVVQFTGLSEKVIAGLSNRL